MSGKCKAAHPVKEGFFEGWAQRCWVVSSNNFTK